MREAAGKGKERWPQVRLGDVCDDKITSISSKENFDIIYIDISSIDNKTKCISSYTKIPAKKAPSRAKQILKLNDILVSTVRPNLNAVAINTLEEDTVVVGSTGYCVLRSTEKIENKYLFYFCQSPTFIGQLVKRAKGASYPAVSNADVKNIKIPLPPLPEQRRIAAVLDQVSSLIALRKAQLAKLDLLVKARFVEMFGTENEFSMWQCGTVADVANVFVGVVIKPAQYYTDKRNGIPAFRSQNIGCMKVKDNDWVYFTEEGHLKNKKTIINENDVLVVRSGTPGIACVASAKCSGYNAVDIIIVRPHQNQINPVFLAMFTNMPHGRNQIKEKTGGAAQQHLNIRSYESMKIIRPPLNLQNQFSAFVKQTNRSECEIQHGLIHLETLKKSLMQEYFG